MCYLCTIEIRKFLLFYLIMCWLLLLSPSFVIEQNHWLFSTLILATLFQFKNSYVAPLYIFFVFAKTLSFLKFFSTTFLIAQWAVFMILVKNLSDNSNISFILVLCSIGYLFKFILRSSWFSVWWEISVDLI